MLPRVETGCGVGDRAGGRLGNQCGDLWWIRRRPDSSRRAGT